MTDLLGMIKAFLKFLNWFVNWTFVTLGFWEYEGHCVEHLIGDGDEVVVPDCVMS